jgi:lysozyme family protein
MNVGQVIDELIAREGDYSDDSADAGGPTRWGVTQAVARAYGYDGDMREYPIETARAVYLSRYWLEPGFDAVAKLSELVAAELFDTGVNMGPAIASRFLQRALNVLNRGATDYPDLIADGRIGPMTLYGLRGYLSARPGQQSDAIVVLLRLLNGQQAMRYIEAAEHRQANERFEYGWIAGRVA